MSWFAAALLMLGRHSEKISASIDNMHHTARDFVKRLHNKIYELQGNFWGVAYRLVFFFCVTFLSLFFSVGVMFLLL